MKRSLAGHWKQTPGRASVIVLLLVHLAAYVIIFLQVGMILELESQRAATPGGAIPYLVLSYTIIVAFLLFVLALIAFVMRVSLSLVFASIAGIGGVLVTSAVAVMYGLRMESAFADLMVVFMFTTPMVAIYLYWRH